VIDPPQVTEVSVGRHIGKAWWTKVERRVAQLRRMDDFVQVATSMSWWIT